MKNGLKCFLLLMAFGILHCGSPPRPRPLEREEGQRQQTTSRRDASEEDRFLNLLGIGKLDELLDFCALDAMPAGDMRFASACHALELIKTKKLLDGAEKELVPRPFRAHAQLDSARSLLGRRAGELDDAAREDVQLLFTQARRGDLLAELVVISRRELQGRLRELTVLLEDTRRAIEASMGYRRLVERADTEGRRRAYGEAVSSGQEALVRGEQVVEQWLEVRRRHTVTAVDERLDIVRGDMGALAERMEDWQAHIDYEVELVQWNAALEQAEQSGEGNAWETYQQMEPLIEEIRQAAEGFTGKPPVLGELLERARKVKEELWVKTARNWTAPERLAAADFEQLVEKYRLVGKLIAGGGVPNIEEVDAFDRTKLTLVKAATERAVRRIEAALERERWEEAQSWVEKVRSLSPQAAEPLAARVAVGVARYLRDQAQLDLEKAYVAEAMRKYEQALEKVEPHITDGAAREISDFIGLEMANLSNQNISLVQLETALLPLGKCLGSHQPLPQRLPFNLVIRQGLIFFAEAGTDYYVRSYDIEMVIPKEDYDRLTLKAMSTGKDRKIPVEITDLLDGRISFILRTTALRETPHVQITVSGADIDLEKIGERWFIHKGVQL
ncbi:MAG: hypothetical protein HOC74_28370 [Gemmatimonadetes bacterium]|nr:hypothetical protein [Gemmatimonadota bacterium]